MTPQESAREKAAVMLAFAEGKAIECKKRYDENDPWQEIEVPKWSFLDFDYRIKREPREFYANLYSRSEDYPCGHIHKSRGAADACHAQDRLECIHVREVL